MKKIAVILTVFNRKEKTINCLRNLARQNIPQDISFDIWMTNDGCTDGTPEAVKREFPNSHIIDGDGTLFWNRGMWTAWNAASNHQQYDYYLWLNDDTNLYDYAIAELVKTSNEHNNTCNIIGSCQFMDHHGVSYGGFINNKVITPNGISQRVEYFNGNIVLVPDYVFKKIGNLDPFYSHSHGDTDYGLRTTEAGMENWIVGRFLGECDRHSLLKKCWNPEVSLRQRIKNLYHPTGYPPYEAFYFERKHKNVVSALFHIFTLYVRTLFPGLWCMMGKAKI